MMEGDEIIIPRCSYEMEYLCISVQENENCSWNEVDPLALDNPVKNEVKEEIDENMEVSTSNNGEDLSQISDNEMSVKAEEHPVYIHMKDEVFVEKENDGVNQKDDGLSGEENSPEQFYWEDTNDNAASDANVTLGSHLHINTSKDSNNFNVCKKLFIQKDVLNENLQSRTSEKSSYEEGHLGNHLKNYTGEKSFRLEDNLRNHFGVHIVKT